MQSCHGHTLTASYLSLNDSKLIRRELLPSLRLLPLIFVW